MPVCAHPLLSHRQQKVSSLLGLPRTLTWPLQRQHQPLLSLIFRLLQPPMTKALYSLLRLVSSRVRPFVPGQRNAIRGTILLRFAGPQCFRLVFPGCLPSMKAFRHDYSIPRASSSPHCLLDPRGRRLHTAMMQVRALNLRNVRNVSSPQEICLSPYVVSTVY